MDDCIINIRREPKKLVRIQTNPLLNNANLSKLERATSKDTSLKTSAVPSLMLTSDSVKAKLRKPKRLINSRKSVFGAAVDFTVHEKHTRDELRPSSSDKTPQDIPARHHLKSKMSKPIIKPHKLNSLTDNKTVSTEVGGYNRNTLSFSAYAEDGLAETRQKVNFRTTGNTLQTKFYSGKTHGTEAVNKIMSSSVSTHIEPVFSSQLWKIRAQDLCIHPHLSSCLLERFKLSHLTAIQATTIPVLLKGDDALVRAQTGSGKTLAYAVPLLNELINVEPPVNRSNGPLALVILPTRELATQTFEVFHGLANACVRIVSACIIGGTKRKAQKSSLRKGVNIVIGTPQRLIDHIIRTTSLHLGRIKWLIIDEADRLLEMGFERCVRQILDHVTKARTSLEHDGTVTSKLQTVLLSATLTQGVEQLAGLALHSPVRCIVVGSAKDRPKGQEYKQDTDNLLLDSHFAMPSGLRHFLLVVPWKLRLVSLAAFLLLKCRYHKNGGKLIVFMATQDCIDFHYQLFKAVLCPDDEEFLSVVPGGVTNLLLFRLHGSMQHSERESVFHQFASSTSGILLTTDVASRGLDLAGVGWVVQYHVTGSPVDYVHRVGRTARAGGKGKALLFLDPSEFGFSEFLENRFQVPFEQRLSLPDLLQTALFHLRHTKRHGQQKAANCGTVEESASRLAHLFMDAVAEDCVLAPLAESAYTSFIRAYASFSGEMRTYFGFKSLHLGHVARAFCLKVTPSEVARRVTGRSRKIDDGTHLKSKKTSRTRKTMQKQSGIGTGLKRGFEDSTSSAPLNKRAKHGAPGGKPISKARQNMLAEYGL